MTELEKLKAEQAIAREAAQKAARDAFYAALAAYAYAADAAYEAARDAYEPPPSQKSPNSSNRSEIVMSDAIERATRAILGMNVAKDFPDGQDTFCGTDLNEWEAKAIAETVLATLPGPVPPPAAQEKEKNDD